MCAQLVVQISSDLSGASVLIIGCPLLHSTQSPGTQPFRKGLWKQVFLLRASILGISFIICMGAGGSIDSINSSFFDALLCQQDTTEDSYNEALKERDGSRTEALKDMHSHLNTFLSTYEINEAPSYEAWIADLHPENTTVSKNGTVTIDRRMYLIDSDHRVMWNEHPKTNEIQEVRERDFRKEEPLPHNRDPKDTPN